MSSSYRRRNHDDHDHTQGFTVPYRDASPDGIEIPIDELDNFIVPGRDEHGGHQMVTVSCPPLLVHQMDVAVRTGLFPYINREALIRHAQVRHLRWLHNIRPDSMEQHTMPALEAMLRQCFEVQMHKKVKAAFDGLRETILQAEQDGEHMEVVRLVNYVKVRLDQVNPGSVWQRRAWRRFMTEFSHYLISAPVIQKKIAEAVGLEMEPLPMIQPSPGKLRRLMNECDEMEEGLVN